MSRSFLHGRDRLTVLKFGGTSVRNAEMIGTVIRIAQSRLSNGAVLVASAMGDTTDALVAIADAATAGECGRVQDLLDEIEGDHRDAAAALTSGRRAAELLERIHELLGELRSLAQGIHLIRECSPRSRDAALSFGERLSTAVIAAAAAEVGIDTVLLDSRDIILTDSEFGAASPQMEETRTRAASRVPVLPGRLVVMQGFIGADSQGVTTTLGRGGSDYTATILGSVLNADSVEIWTDVNGIMTADPRLIPEAKPIPLISYDEAAELAYFGARVVHPSTILPAVRQQIPVYVRNTSDPDGVGTEIREASRFAGIRAMASKSGITVITVQSSRMLNAYGFLRALFSVFEEQRIPVDLVATSEVSVSVTVDREIDRTRLVGELEKLGTVTVETDQAIVCLVGREVFRDASVVGRVFESLGSIPVRLISLGSSEINLSLVLAERHVAGALTALHARFFST